MRSKLTLVGLVGIHLAVVAALGACQSSTAEPTEGPAADEGTAVEVVTDTAGAAASAAEVDVFRFDPVPPGGPSALTVGQTGEPGSLYIYGDNQLAAALVLASIYDGPIEGLAYGYQAVILEELPELGVSDGATLETVDVEAGQRYVDARTQEVLTADEPVADLPQITVRFKIRDGVTWQDGTPVTAEDSVFSAELACDPDTGTAKDLCARTDHYVKIDDQTVEWRGIPGYTDQTYYTNFYTPLPRHQAGADGRRMDEMSAAEIAADADFGAQPYSYGPFQVAEWVAGDHIQLTRNEHYWRQDEGLPFLDTVVHRFYDDADAILAALLSGEVDVASQDGLQLTQYDDLQLAAADGSITTYYVGGPAWEHIDFQLLPADERLAPGACLEVRQAVALGTDRQAMIDEVTHGLADARHGLVPDSHWAYPSSGLDPLAYDPAAARALLEDLGFVEPEQGGTLQAGTDIVCTAIDPDGQPVEYTIPAGTPLEMKLATTQGESDRERLARMFQDDMADIGVRIDLDFLSSDALLDPGPEGVLTGRRYDLALFAWLTGAQPPVALYSCDGIPTEANGWVGLNNTGWCNPEYDLLALRAASEMQRDDAVDLYAESLRLLSQELPSLPLFGRLKVIATRSDLVNFAPDETATAETWNIETWGLAPAQ